MSLRLTPVSIALLVAGCGPPPAPPPSHLPARTWQYYVAHNGENEAMQAIRRKWSAGERKSTQLKYRPSRAHRIPLPYRKKKQNRHLNITQKTNNSRIIDT